MLPTIDLSLIGILLIIWNVIKTIWGFIWGAIKWTKDAVASAILGSKLWATVAFLAVSLTVVGLVSVVISAVINWVAGLVYSSLTLSVLSDTIQLVSTIFPLSAVSRVISVYAGCLFFMFTLKKYCFWYSRVCYILTHLKSSWKT